MLYTALKRSYAIFICELSKANTNYRIIGQNGQIKISTVYDILLELRLAHWLVAQQKELL